jgi:ubiquitin carboxyl-terminal hydrolase 14
LPLSPCLVDPPSPPTHLSLQIFDVYEYCTPPLQQSLRINREKADKESEEYFNKRLKVDPSLPPAPDSEMEVVGSGEGASSAPPVPDESTLKTDPAEGEALDFGEGIPSSFRGHYELMGIVTHKGRTADSGHYIGWVRSAPGSSLWWKYDDETVTEMATSDIMNLKGGGDWHTAYLSFYRFKN